MQAYLSPPVAAASVASQALSRDYSRDYIYQQLMSHQSGLTNDHALACMIASWYCDQSSLPARLGLTLDAWQALLTRHFPGCQLPPKLTADRAVDFARMPEVDDLRTLLHEHRNNDSVTTAAIAEIIIYGCLGSDHLWQDLGLWSRPDLTTLFRDNFATLAEKNNKDMKWKKFLYKQLCQQEGIYVCRAPSCEVCSDYQQCFGPEE